MTAIPLLMLAGCGRPGWDAFTDKDSMTDATNVFVQKLSEEDGQSSLVIRCMNGSTSVAVINGEKIAADGDDGASLKWRFDQNPPESGVGGTLIGEKGVILPTDDPAALIRRMEAARKLTVEIDGNVEVTLTFDVTGLADAIRPYKWACNWKDLG
jgi:hypothetical protein